MENNGYREGINILKKLKRTINEINVISKIIDRANKSLNNNQDDLWQQIYNDNNEQLNKLQDKYSSLYQSFCLTKTNCNEDEWNKLITKWGYILAETTNITHVKDSLFDNKEVINSVNVTSSILNDLYSKVESAKESNYLDDVIIYNSQIKWFKNDLANHPLGIDVLKRINMETNNYNKIA